MSAVVTLAGLRCVSARVVLPYTGVWFADVDIDPDQVAQVQSLISAAGATVPLTIGVQPKATLLGVIDPLASGTFGQTGRVRVVGGRGGWSKDVAAQHFPSPGTTQAVYSQTAALVKETVSVANPQPVADNYVRLAGPASRVLRDEESWWVDPMTAITYVATRPAAKADPSLELMTWDPGGQIAEVRSDTLVLPGTVLADSRIGGGQVTLRDIDQTFDANGSRATCMCSTSTVSRLLVALQTLIREHCKTGFLKIARYRYVQDAGSSTVVGLQAVDRNDSGQASPYPDLLPVTTWTGMAGITAELPDSLEVLVGFVDGDPKQPVVIGYSTLALPRTLTLDATDAVHLAPGSNSSPVARVDDTVVIAFPPLMQIAGTVSGAPFVGVLTITTPGLGIIQTGSPKVDAG